MAMGCCELVVLNPLYVNAASRQLILQTLIAAVEVVDASDMGGATGNHARKHQGYAGPKVGAHYPRATEYLSPVYRDCITLNPGPEHPCGPAPECD